MQVNSLFENKPRVGEEKTTKEGAFVCGSFQADWKCFEAISRIASHMGA